MLEIILFLFKFFLLFSGLGLIFYFDIKEKIIPDFITLPLIILGLVINYFLTVNLVTYFFAMILGYLIFWLINFVGKLIYKKDVMGGGDAKLMALIGAFVGCKLMLLTIYFSFIFGGVLALFLIIFKLNKKGDYLPFGPIIIIALIFCLIFKGNIPVGI